LYYSFCCGSVLQVEFRGRPLYGAPIEIPTNFHGLIGHRTDMEDSPPESDNQNKNHRLVADFTEFTYWNWDKKPSANDTPAKLLDWLNVSEIVIFSL